ncbi:type II toxin-antitoxin system PemK/MazF family toxin [Enterococcus italicus]|uniref:type II toxin-antitoxin system PemK/MazF family toxin n=1 Tax=Enterococcus italicus TaxID=246144 RepID=UPI003FA33CB9
MIRRRDVYLADLSPVVGSEQGGVRPVLIVQNNLGNHFSPTVIVVAITAKISKPKLPTHISLPASKSGLERDSVILTEQIRTIDKSRLKDKIYRIDEEKMIEVEKAIKVSVGIDIKVSENGLLPK